MRAVFENGNEFSVSIKWGEFFLS